MDAGANRGHSHRGTDLSQQAVVATAAGQRAPGPELRHHDLEHETGVVFEVSAELGRELRLVRDDAGFVEIVQPALEALQRLGKVKAMIAQQLMQFARGSARLQAALHVLVHLARGAPVLVAIDDLQWLDAPSVHVLRFALSWFPSAKRSDVGSEPTCSRVPWQVAQTRP